MGDAFARAVSRQAVAQIALTVGCQHAYPSVLDSLADLVKDFIMQVGKAAQEKCEAEGRTALSVLDLKAALEHGQVFGKEPMQRLDVDFRHLQLFAFKESADSTEIGTPESLNWHQPFHTRIPPFPVRKRPRLPPSGWLPGQRAAHVSLEPGTAVSVDGSAAAARRPGYVPAFLPPFPPEHTYKRTARGAVSKTKDAAEIQKRRVETKQLVQRALRRMGGAFDDSAGGEASRKRKASSVDDEEDGDAVAMEIADEHANGLANGHMNGDRSALSPQSKEGPADGKGKKRAKEKQKEEKEEEEGEEYLFSSKQHWFRPLAATSASVPSASAPPPVVTEQHPYSAAQSALPPQQQQEQQFNRAPPTVASFPTNHQAPLPVALHQPPMGISMPPTQAGVAGQDGAFMSKAQPPPLPPPQPPLGMAGPGEGGAPPQPPSDVTSVMSI